MITQAAAADNVAVGGGGVLVLAFARVIVLIVVGSGGIAAPGVSRAFGPLNSVFPSFWCLHAKLGLCSFSEHNRHHHHHHHHHHRPA